MENSQSFKRLIRKYEFLLEDWEDVEEIASGAMSDFIADVGKNLPPEIQQSDYLVDPKKEEKEHTEETESDKVLKKLFRKIVLQCHPDRLIGDFSELERIRRISLYERAVSAHDNKNWALMVITAIKLDVELPEEAESMVDSISEEANKLEEKIANSTNSPSWQYFHSSKEDREVFVQNYINLIKTIKSGKISNGLEITEPVELVKPKETKLILGLGHPRTGTGYTAKLLQSWGLDVGHEKMGSDGTVDWSLAAGDKSAWQEINFKDWEWQNVIYCLRDPRYSIPSIVYTEEKSLAFRESKISLRNKSNPINSAIDSIVGWDNLILNLNPSIIYKIEEDSKELFEYLKNAEIPVKWNSSLIDIKQNEREHPSWEEMLDEFGFIPSRFKISINKYCDTYGYDRLF